MPASSWSLTEWLLNVEHLAVQESHLEILVDINFLGSQVHDFLRLAHRAFDLFRGHPLLNVLRLGLRLLLLVLICLLTLPALLVTLLSTLLPTALIIAGLLRVVTDGEQLADGIFHVTRTGLGQGSLGKNEDHVRLVVGRRVGLVAGVASDDAHDHLVFVQIYIDLGRVNFVALGEQLGRLFVIHGIWRIGTFLVNATKFFLHVTSFSRGWVGSGMNRPVLKGRRARDRSLVGTPLDSPLFIAP